MFKHLGKRVLLLTLITLSAAFNATAAQVETRLASGIAATADYRAGDPSLPAVLILHGFLQTKDSPTVKQLADGLADSRYPILAPTLSLNIPKRSRSLACEAIHTHDMSDAMTELGAWISWLKQKGHKRIILIGHSQGAMQVLAYAVEKPDPAVAGIIGLSLVRAENPRQASDQEQQLSQVRQQAEKAGAELQTYELSFCKKYLTRPAHYLSYAGWTRDRILKAATASKVPALFILGGSDDRMGADWPEQLRRKGVSVVVIEGANHFFDAQQEFDLLDAVLNALRPYSAKK